MNFKNSLLETKFRFKEELPKPDIDNGYFFDRDPDYFLPIYEYMMGWTYSLIPNFIDEQYKNLNKEKFYFETCFWNIFESNIQSLIISKKVGELILRETKPDEKYDEIPEITRNYGEYLIELLSKMIQNHASDMYFIPLVTDTSFFPDYLDYKLWKKNLRINGPGYGHGPGPGPEPGVNLNYKSYLEHCNTKYSNELYKKGFNDDDYIGGLNKKLLLKYLKFSGIKRNYETFPDKFESLIKIIKEKAGKMLYIPDEMLNLKKYLDDKLRGVEVVMGTSTCPRLLDMACFYQVYSDKDFQELAEILRESKNLITLIVCLR